MMKNELLFVVCSGEKQRGVYRKHETAAKIVESLDYADKYINCCYEPGFHHIKVIESEGKNEKIQ